MLQTSVTPAFETVIESRAIRRKRAKTPLEILTRKFELRTSQSIKRLERVIPYITTPWWTPPLSRIAQDKDKAKKLHDEITSTV